VRELGGGEASMHKYMPLNTCMECIANKTSSFIMCAGCTQQKHACPHAHAANKMIHVQRHVFNMIRSLRYACPYCADDDDKSEQIGNDADSKAMYGPIALRHHLLNECQKYFEIIKSDKSNILQSHQQSALIDDQPTRILR
jgi:hypothetical protein